MIRFSLNIVRILVFAGLALAYSLVSPNAALAAGEIPIDNPNLGWSPYGWVASGSTYKQSPTVGSYLDVAFTGTTLGINVDTSMVVAPAVPANIKVNAYIDGDTVGITKSLADVSGGQIIFTTALSPSSHYATIVLSVNPGSGDRWNVTSGTPKATLRITSVQLSPAGIISPLTITPLARTGPRIIYYGDSITEGNAIGGAGIHGESSTAARVGQLLGGPYGIHGYASLTWWFALLSNTSEFFYPSSDIANHPNAVWNNYYQGASLLNTAGVSSSGYKDGVPDAVFNNLGINDTSSFGLAPPFGGQTALNYFAANISGWLTEQRAALGARPAIFMVMPFNYNCTTEINPAYNAGIVANLQMYRQLYIDTINSYIASNQDSRVYLIDLGAGGCQTVISNSIDGLHPNAAGAAALSAQISALAQPNIIMDMALTAKAGEQDLAAITLLGRSPLVSGTAPAGSTVTVSVQPGGHSCTAVASLSGTWSCTLQTLTAAGSYTIQVSAVTTYGETLTYGPYTVTVSADAQNVSNLLAETGDPVSNVILLGLVLMLSSSALGYQLVIAQQR